MLASWSRSPPANRQLSYTPSQADVATFKALKSAPDAAKYPHAARWYKHIATFEDEFPTLEGDATKPYTAYGPEESELALNPALPVLRFGGGFWWIGARHLHVNASSVLRFVGETWTSLPSTAPSIKSSRGQLPDLPYLARRGLSNITSRRQDRK